MHIAPCPILPQIRHPLPIHHSRSHRLECSLAYYTACLELAQSRWMAQHPAQAILQLDKSMMALLTRDHPILERYPIPYVAIRWIMENAPPAGYLGNPVRHFQHLASRMSPRQPQPELRSYRAWACYHIASACLPATLYPQDHRQLLHENLRIPDLDETKKHLASLSQHTHEITWFENALPSNTSRT